LAVNRDNYQLSDIKKIILNHINSSKSELHPDTRIGEDLCIIGDDAIELLDDYGKQFSVDLSGLDFSDYFPDEATSEMNYYMSSHSKNKISRILGLVDGWFWEILAKKKSI